MSKKIIAPCDFNDSAIKRFQNDGQTYELNIINHPLRVRFTKRRDKASWFVKFSKEGKEVWRKIGEWPLLSAKKLKPQIQDIVVNVAAGQNVRSITADHFETVGDMLQWFLVRNDTDCTISPERRVQLRSVINRHLVPTLSTLLVKHVSKANIEERLLWPLQAKYELATIKGYFAVLSVVFERAFALDKLSYNPMLEIKFKKLIKKDIAPKEGRLKPGHIPQLLTTLEDGEHTMAKALVFIMLSHATRQGETRQARWSHIDLSNMTWYLPIANIKTKRHEHTLPLTPEVFEYLKSHRNFLKSKGYEGDYLFPSNLRKKDSLPISRSKACRLIKAFSNDEWCSHDLRKLAATTWKERGEDYLVIKFLLNHHIPNLDRTYIQAKIDPQKREVLSRWQAFLNEEKTKTIARW